MKLTALGGLAALGLVLLTGACQRDAAQTAARDHSADVAAPSATDAATASADPRDQPVPKFDGKPIWSANASKTAEQNAQASFERNGAVFGVASLDDYIAKAHAFTGSPPAGAETIRRASNGDTLIYDPAQNIFAVVTKDGAPRTMFKPDNGAAYWEEQKAIEAAK